MWRFVASSGKRGGSELSQDALGLVHGVAIVFGQAVALLGSRAGASAKWFARANLPNRRVAAVSATHWNNVAPVNGGNSQTNESSANSTKVDSPSDKSVRGRIVNKPHLVKELRERRVPTSSIERVMSYGGMAAVLVGGAMAETTRRLLGPTQQGQSVGSAFLTPKNAERLAAGLCRMRGAALKLGQMLSLQDETLLPPQVQAALDRVREGADVMPRAQLERVLTEELGSEWKEKVKNFDYSPIAAASIGQVHYACREDGSPIAMKVQYPGVAQSIRSDLMAVKRLLQVADVFPRGLYIDNVVEVAHDELTNECNYKREAANQMRFRKLVQDDPRFYVPKVISELSTDRILVSEFVQGMPLDQTVNLPQEKRNALGQALMNLELKALFEWHFVQTDPNWANFLYNRDEDVLYLIDFGAARDFDKSFVDEYLRMVWACAQRDRDTIIESSIKLGFLTGDESKLMIDSHVESAFVVGEPFSEDAPYDFKARHVTERLKPLASTMLTERLTPPPVEAYTLHRKLSGLYLSCIKLGAVFSCRPSLERLVSLY